MHVPAGVWGRRRGAPCMCLQGWGVKGGGAHACACRGGGTLGGLRFKSGMTERDACGKYRCHASSHAGAIQVVMLVSCNQSCQCRASSHAGPLANQLPSPSPPTHTYTHSAAPVFVYSHQHAALQQQPGHAQGYSRRPSSSSNSSRGDGHAEQGHRGGGH